MATYLKDANKTGTLGIYSVLEPNFLAARRTGQVRAQLPLDATDFLTVKAENGMILKYNEVTGAVESPTNSADISLMLHFSVEKEYDHVHPGLNTFALTTGEFYPRLYQLHVGDTFITDAVKLHASDDQTISTLYDAIAKGNVFSIDSGGWITIVGGSIHADYSAVSVAFQVIDDVATLPSGGKAIKFKVVKAI